MKEKRMCGGRRGRGYQKSDGMEENCSNELLQVARWKGYWKGVGEEGGMNRR